MKRDYIRPLMEVTQVYFGAALLDGSPIPPLPTEPASGAPGRKGGKEPAF